MIVYESARKTWADNSDQSGITSVGETDSPRTAPKGPEGVGAQDGPESAS
jgi:hypothetical protein